MTIWDGACWGYETPDEGEEPISWQLWQYSNGETAQVTGNLEWGYIKVFIGSSLYSSVINTNNSDPKQFDITLNKYGFSSDAVITYIRGSESSFNQLDSAPDWEIYTSPIYRVWRYIQLKMEYTNV